MLCQNPTRTTHDLGFSETCRRFFFLQHIFRPLKIALREFKKVLKFRKAFWRCLRHFSEIYITLSNGFRKFRSSGYFRKLVTGSSGIQMWILLGDSLRAAPKTDWRLKTALKVEAMEARSVLSSCEEHELSQMTYSSRGELRKEVEAVPHGALSGRVSRKMAFFFRVLCPFLLVNSQPPNLITPKLFMPMCKPF